MLINFDIFNLLDLYIYNNEYLYTIFNNSFNIYYKYIHSYNNTFINNNPFISWIFNINPNNINYYNNQFLISKINLSINNNLINNYNNNIILVNYFDNINTLDIILSSLIDSYVLSNIHLNNSYGITLYDILFNYNYVSDIILKDYFLNLYNYNIKYSDLNELKYFSYYVKAVGLSYNLYTEFVLLNFDNYNANYSLSHFISVDNIVCLYKVYLNILHYPDIYINLYNFNINEEELSNNFILYVLHNLFYNLCGFLYWPSNFYIPIIQNNNFIIPLDDYSIFNYINIISNTNIFGNINWIMLDEYIHIMNNIYTIPNIYEYIFSPNDIVNNASPTDTIFSNNTNNL